MLEGYTLSVAQAGAVLAIVLVGITLAPIWSMKPRALVITLASIVFLAVLIVTFGCGVRAQTLPGVSVPSLPFTVTMVVDDANLATTNPLTYIATLDGGPPITFTTTKPAPCTACATAPLTVTTVGTHTISLVAKNDLGTSGPFVQQFTVAIEVSQPKPPTKLTFTVLGATPGGPDLPGPPAPGGADVPPALSLLDPLGATWTRSPAPVPCPVIYAGIAGAQCFNILRNGVVAGIGDAVFRAGNGRIYRHTPDAQWHEWQPDGTWWACCFVKPPA